MSHKNLSKNDAPKNITNNEKKLGENNFIISKTNLKGKIIYCNEIFTEMSGYDVSELIGANHNIIRHPDMPKIAFNVLWDLIKNKKEFFGFVKNLRKNGDFYWVFAYITADLDSRGNIISYTSVRRKPPQSAIDAITPVYKLLVDAERRGGMEASQRVLIDFLAEKKMSYDELVTALQLGAK